MDFGSPHRVFYFSNANWRHTRVDQRFVLSMALSAWTHGVIVAAALIAGLADKEPETRRSDYVARTFASITVKQPSTSLKGDGIHQTEADYFPEITIPHGTDLMSEELDLNGGRRRFVRRNANAWPDQVIPLPRQRYSNGVRRTRTGSSLGRLMGQKGQRNRRKAVPNRGGVDARKIAEILARNSMHHSRHQVGQLASAGKFGHDFAGKGSGNSCTSSECAGGVHSTIPGSYCDSLQTVRQTSLHFSDLGVFWKRIKEMSSVQPGRLVMKWGIGADGRVLNPTVVKDTVGHGTVQYWAIEKVKSLRYKPVPGKGCVLIWHMGFGVNLRSMNETLDQIAQRILDDEQIDENELKELEAIVFDDTFVTARELRFLSALDVGSKDEKNDEGWSAFLIHSNNEHQKSQWEYLIPEPPPAAPTTPTNGGSETPA